MCPECKNYYPKIENFEYNDDIKDLIIKYTCICFKEEKNIPKKSLLINFISTNIPKDSNDIFISKENSEKMFKLVKEKKDEIKGFDVLERVINEECILDRSVAPLAFSIKNSTFKSKSYLNSVNNSINNSVKKSNLKESGINNEASPYYKVDDNVKLSEKKKKIHFK